MRRAPHARARPAHSQPAAGLRLQRRQLKILKIAPTRVDPRCLGDAAVTPPLDARADGDYTLMISGRSTTDNSISTTTTVRVKVLPKISHGDRLRARAPLSSACA